MLLQSYAILIFLQHLMDRAHGFSGRHKTCLLPGIKLISKSVAVPHEDTLLSLVFLTPLPPIDFNFICPFHQ